MVIFFSKITLFKANGWSKMPNASPKLHLLGLMWPQIFQKNFIYSSIHTVAFQSIQESCIMPVPAEEEI